MENKLVPIAPMQVPGSATPVQPVEPASNGRVKHDPADLRLVIEEDRESGIFIYKTIDRRTGDVVQQLPRDEVLRLHHAMDYDSGTIINARI